jgi:hypothetical protein
MTIADLGSVGEFIGSIVVLITLIYLAIQVRQNTRHVQAQMGHDAWLANTNDEIAKFGDDAAETLAKADLGGEGLTGKDLKILDANFRSLLLHMGRVEYINALGLYIYSVEQTALAYVDLFNSKAGKAWLKSNVELTRVLAPKVCARLEEMLEEPTCRSRSRSFIEFKRRLSGISDVAK